MKDKKEKAELREWLDKLMKYAKDNKLSMRIIDGIDDCIGMAEARDPDIEAIKAAVDELLNSISHKVSPPAEINAGEEKVVSIEDIREEITRMARRCQNENAESLQNIEDRKRAVIQNAYLGLQEITHCEAHIRELKNDVKYLQFYELAKTSYEKGAVYVFKEFLNDLANNYQFMADHMKSMFRSIGGAKSGLGSRRFYEEHDIRREEIARKLETVAQSSDCGGSDIEELGNTTKKKIGNIVKKCISRMRFFILLPVLIVLLVLGAGIALKYVQWERAQDKAAQEQEADKELDIQDVIEMLYETKELADTLEEMPAISEIVIMMVFVLLVIIVIYAIYIMLMKAMCNRRICKKCSTYLQQEWSQFKNKDPLRQKMDKVLNDLQVEYNSQYLVLLNQLFAETDYDMSNGGNKAPFESLKEEWTAIKYG